MPPESKAEVIERFDREVARCRTSPTRTSSSCSTSARSQATGAPFIALEWLEGERLGRHIRERGRCRSTETWAITRQLLLALTEVHECGYVHRDVSANNVMLTQVDGRLHVKLIDFGLVKPRPGHYQAVTRPGVIVRHSVGDGARAVRAAARRRARRHLRGRGALTFMLTGKNPLQGATLAEAGRARLREQRPHRPSEDVALHPAVDAVVTRCLERRPRSASPAPRTSPPRLERVVRHAQSSSLRTRARNVVALCLRPRTVSPQADRALDEMVRVMSAESVGWSVSKT